MFDPPLILLVGKAALDAWRDIAAQLPAVESVDVANLEAAILWLDAAQREPAWIVIAQAWPGEISPNSVAAIQRRAPLARVCALLGNWCEGEMRSGKPWPGVVRVYDHQWPLRAARQLLRFVRGQKGAWSLPVTASEEERLLVEIESAPAADGLVGVVAANPETAAALADACRSAGYTVLALGEVRAARVPDARVLVWDTMADIAADRAAVARLRHCCGTAPIIAMLGFPRGDEIRHATAAGIAAVVSKPFLLADLHYQLAVLVRARPPRRFALQINEVAG